jgi:hypothetical protein
MTCWSAVGYRLRSFMVAEQLGNVPEACRLMGVHRSTYYEGVA